MIVQENSENNIFHSNLSFTGGVIISILVLSLIALGERILFDLGNHFAPPPLDYFENLNVILVHSLFIIPLLVVCLLLSINVTLKNNKYAIVVIPYYIFSIVMALQLALQVGVYFTYHHTVVQFYIVMTMLTIICTYGVYYIQKKFNPN